MVESLRHGGGGVAALSIVERAKGVSIASFLWLKPRSGRFPGCGIGGRYPEPAKVGPLTLRLLPESAWILYSGGGRSAPQRLPRDDDPATDQWAT